MVGGVKELGVKVCIIGGGIVGASTAYFLRQRGIASVVIEQTSVACHASGRVAGFLSSVIPQDATQGFSEQAFVLLKELSEKFGADKIQYRPMKCLNTEAGAKPLLGSQSWLDNTKGYFRILGDETNTAQVHPYKLTTALMEESKAKVVIDEATGVVQDAVGKVTGVLTAAGGTIACDYLVIATGPWASYAVEWFPGLHPSLYHSVGSMFTSTVLDTVLDNTAVMVGDGSLEIHPRANEVYVSGLPLTIVLPRTAEEVYADTETSVLSKKAGMVASSLLNAQVKVTQACCLPSSTDNLPVIGCIPNTPNAFIGCGLGRWLIMNGPLTGKVLSELIAGAPLSENIKAFAPGR